MKRFFVGLVAVGVVGGLVGVGRASAGPGPGDGFAGIGLGSASGYRVLGTPGGVKGLDVSNFQGVVDWAGVKKKGAQFAFVKATESVNYTSPAFRAQYDGARGVKLLRGAYHFAQPHESGGGAQADYLVDHGGGWSKDGWTLPAALDIENNPYGPINHLNECYDFSRTAMVNWIRDFSSQYKKRTGAWPVIYTNTAWWRSCTGDYGGFAGQPLWLANHASVVGPLPAGWRRQAFWQYATSGVFPGDQNVFNGAFSELQVLAASGYLKTRTGISGLNAGPEPVRKGRKITVVGKLNRDTGGWHGFSGRRVDIYFQARGSKAWTYADHATTGSTGAFKVSFTARKDGSWRALYRGDAKHLPVTSAADYVDVR